MSFPVALIPYGKNYTDDDYRRNVAALEVAFAQADDVGKVVIYRLLAKEARNLARYWEGAANLHKQIAEGAL